MNSESGEHLIPGRYVRVRSGMLEGVVGVISDVEDGRARIELPCRQGGISLEIDIRLLEDADVEQSD